VREAFLEEAGVIMEKLVNEIRADDEFASVYEHAMRGGW
jgi:hypothetical protein